MSENGDSVVKWAVFAGTFVRERYETLHEVLKEHHVENEFEILSPDKENFVEGLKLAQQDHDQIRVDTPYGHLMVEELTHLSSDVRTIGAADCLMQSEGTWWPRNCLFEGLNRLFASKFDKVDLKNSVFIIGTGAAAKSAIASLVRLGFKKINITDRFNEQVQGLVGELKKNYFNVEFQFTPADALTLLPGNHQVIFNTTPLVSSNELLHELYYFNYMASDGIVVDMTLVPVETPLLKEAISVSAQAVSGAEVAAWSDVFWLESCFAVNVSVSDYLERLAQRLELIEFDISPFVIQ